MEMGIAQGIARNFLEQLVRHSLETSCLDSAVKQRKSAAHKTPCSNKCISLSLSISI